MALLRQQCGSRWSARAAGLRSSGWLPPRPFLLSLQLLQHKASIIDDKGLGCGAMPLRRDCGYGYRSMSAGGSTREQLPAAARLKLLLAEHVCKGKGGHAAL